MFNVQLLELFDRRLRQPTSLLVLRDGDSEALTFLLLRVCEGRSCSFKTSEFFVSQIHLIQLAPLVQAGFDAYENLEFFVGEMPER